MIAVVHFLRRNRMRDKDLLFLLLACLYAKGQIEKKYGYASSLIHSGALLVFPDISSTNVNNTTTLSQELISSVIRECRTRRNGWYSGTASHLNSKPTVEFPPVCNEHDSGKRGKEDGKASDKSVVICGNQQLIETKKQRVIVAILLHVLDSEFIGKVFSMAFSARVGTLI
ncbi:hypothetical protein VNO77_17733 [Canavalia gladiata]|uniref:Uncharacterized protein n=1 Tax=Canavalia gladiata TaxID=3824 RepID=A0AAN9LJP5_CANGL